MKHGQTETGGILASTNDVTGTAINDKAGEKAGTIDHLMNDNPSGKAAYSIMSFGGFLGLGEQQFTIPLITLNAGPVMRSCSLRIR